MTGTPPNIPGKPTNFRELFSFYHNYVKLLYSTVSAEGSLPQETLFELNAALDHISRHWAYHETEEQVVEKAYSHLKRSCLDVFKLKLNDANRMFLELREIDASIIDNGEFDRELIKLHQEIKAGAREARRLEGEVREDDNGAIAAFDRWEPVYRNCLHLESAFYQNPHLDWARKKDGAVTRKTFYLGILASCLAALITGAFIPYAWGFLQRLLDGSL